MDTGTLEKTLDLFMSVNRKADALEEENHLVSKEQLVSSVVHVLQTISLLDKRAE